MCVCVCVCNIMLMSKCCGKVKTDLIKKAIASKRATMYVCSNSNILLPVSVMKVSIAGSPTIPPLSPVSAVTITV